MSSIPDAGTLQRLAEFVHELALPDLPTSAMARVEDLVVDSVGCALGGWVSSEVPAVLSAFGLGSVGDATVMGGGMTATLIDAVMINAYLTTAITVCDVYVPAHCHLTPCVVPPALAVAEQTGASGEELLAAVAAGLEVATRVARSLDFGDFRRRGWHSPGIVGPFGAAAAVSRLLGLDPMGIAQSMSLAYSQAAGTAASWPTPAVKFHQSRGAVSGLISGYLAREGFEAAKDPLHDGDGGLYSTYASGDPARAVADLGSDWELEQISLRLWPGATTVQSLLTVLNGAPGALPEPDDVAEIEIRVPPVAYSAHAGVSTPTTTFEALLSFHHVAATILLNHTFDISLAVQPWLSDPRVRGLAERIVLRADESIPLGGVVVRFELNDGQSLLLRQDIALGAPANPASRQQVDRKFLMNANTRLVETDTASILAQLRGLKDLSGTRQLMADIGAAGGGPAVASDVRLGGARHA